MNISFVILTWNSKKHIEQCLTSIFNNASDSLAPYEILIVDNGSSDGTLSIIQKFEMKYPEIVKVIQIGYNSGTTYSRNIALKMSKGAFIAIIDSDVNVLPSVLETLIETLVNDDQIGLVAPKLVYANGKFQQSTDNFPTVFTKIYRYFFLKHIENKTNYNNNSDYKQSVDYAISAFWLLKRKVFEKVGLLDENIFYSPEDVDYCLRIWKSGYRIVYVPNVSSVHYAQEISRGFRMNKATIEHIKGLLYFFKKHGYFFKKPVFIEK